MHEDDGRFRTDERIDLFGFQGDRKIGQTGKIHDLGCRKTFFDQLVVDGTGRYADPFACKLIEALICIVI